MAECDKNRTTLHKRLSDFETKHGVHSKGALSVVLTLTRNFGKERPPYREDDLKSPKKGQVKGLGGAAIKAILADYGITQTLASEGGRTSRGSIELMSAYVKFANELHNKDQLCLEEMERWWIGRVEAFFASKPLRVKVDSSKSHRQIVSELIAAAYERQNQCPGTMIVGAVMQHLVGAKLELVLPDVHIEHHGFSVADEPSSRSGDFFVGDTAIHVTTAPTEALLSKCCRNLEANLRPLIITTEKSVGGAYALAQNARISARIDVLDIEQFLTTNIYEWCRFQGQQRSASMNDLVTIYNQIVHEVEGDPRLNIRLG